MQALFFKFAKRTNSTKRPNDATGTPLNITIRQNYTNKEGDRTSRVCRPTFFITDINDNFDTSFNYMKYGGRYYFIRDIKRGYDRTAILECEIDALATLKTEILATRAHVLYSSSDYSLQLSDNRNMVSNNVSYAQRISDSPMFEQDFYFGGGTFIVTAIGLHGAICDHTFFLGPTDYKVLTDFLLGLSQEDIFEGLLAFLDPVQSIASVKWTPIYLRGTAATDITLGKLSLDPPLIGGFYPNRHIGAGGIRIQIPHIYPNDYRGGSRFSKYYLTVPFCGVYPINADDIFGEEYVTLTYQMDVVTGEIAGAVYTGTTSQPTGNSNLISFGGNAYSDVPFGQVVDPMSVMGWNMVMSAATMGISAVAFNGMHSASPGLSRGYGSVHSGLSFSGNNILSGMEKAAQVNGINGGTLSKAVGLGAISKICMVCIANESAYEPTAIRDVLGLPSSKIRLIDGLSGYCQTTGFSVVSSELTEIVDLVNMQMDNGVFIE